MKERPILFSGPMVRAILEGRKTQTRRPVRLPDGHAWTFDRACAFHSIFGPDSYLFRDGDWSHGTQCPYGLPRHRLWVREASRIIHESNHHSGQSAYTIEYKAGGELIRNERLPSWYPDKSRNRDGRPRWTPSIHMPRWACRIVLEVVSVRVERLQDISEEDARAEGSDPYDWQYDNGEGPESYREAFRCLWDSINGADAWERNPWVWCIEFKRVEGK